MSTPPDSVIGSTVDASHEQDAAAPRYRLRGNLGVIGLLFTVMAFNAPLGTFVATVPVSIGFGNGAGAPILFLVGGLVMALVAVGLIKMNPYMTNSGGFYLYITAGLGKVVGLGTAFLATVSYFLMVLGATTFFGYSANALVTDVFGGPEISWWVYAFGVLAVVSFLGYQRIDISSNVLTVVLITEMAVIFIYNLVVVVRGGSSGLNVSATFDPSIIASGSLGIALLLGVSAMGGFEATLIYREEVRDPKRTIPRATFLFILITAVMYCFTSWAMVQAVGTKDAVAVYSEDPAGALLGTIQSYLGGVGHDIVLVLLANSVLASVLAAHNVATRYVFNLGNDMILPRALAEVHEKHHSPYKASLAVSVASVLALLPFIIFKADASFLFVQLLSSYSYAFLLMVAITCIAVAAFLLRHKPQGTTLWHQLVAPALGFVGVAGTLVFATLNLDVLFGNAGPAVVAILSLFFGLLLLGMIVAVRLRTSRPDIYALIGRQ